MTRYGRMQRVMLRVLAVMLVASFGLAVVALALPAPAAAYCLPQQQCWIAGSEDRPCGSCIIHGISSYRYWKRIHCCWQCTGTNPYCYIVEGRAPCG